MSWAEISTIFWRERQLLELLLFKLEEEQLLLAAGRARFLAHATREVEAVLDEVKRAELARAVAVDALAAEIGLDPNPSLRALIDVAPEPWRGIFTDHRDAFLAATQEITSVADGNRELLASGQRALREMLRDAAGPDDDETYAPTGAAPRSQAVPAMLVDEAL